MEAPLFIPIRLIKMRLRKIKWLGWLYDQQQWWALNPSSWFLVLVHYSVYKVLFHLNESPTIECWTLGTDSAWRSFPSYQEGRQCIKRIWHGVISGSPNSSLIWFEEGKYGQGWLSSHLPFSEERNSSILAGTTSLVSKGLRSTRRSCSTRWGPCLTCLVWVRIRLYRNASLRPVA